MKLIIFSLIAIFGMTSFAQESSTPSSIPTGLTENRQSVSDPNNKKNDRTKVESNVFVPSYRGENYCAECERILQQPGVSFVDDKNPDASPKKRRLFKPGSKPANKNPNDPANTGK